MHYLAQTGKDITTIVPEMSDLDDHRGPRPMYPLFQFDMEARRIHPIMLKHQSAVPSQLEQHMPLLVDDQGTCVFRARACEAPC